jgi:membrane-bound serine protease (ClpP class)
MHMAGFARIFSFVMVLAMFGWASQAQTTRATTRPANDLAVVIVIKGDINAFTQRTLKNGVEEARQVGAGTVILQMKTPGGLVSSGLEMARYLKQQKDVHTVAFIEGYAYSAGTMIAMACDEIVMEPNAAIGDCAPISIADGQLVTLGETERAKVQSPILADFYDSASRNGYDPDLTAAFVVVGRNVHWIENDEGTRDFVDTKEYNERVKEGGPWKSVAGVPNPIDGNDMLLTAHTELAMKLGLAKAESANIQALASLRGYTIAATYMPSSGEKLIALLDSDIVRFLLMLIFMQSLYAALHVPGHGFPEALAVSSLALLIGVPLLTGYAQWWEIAAILVGLVLIAVEIFVLPGFGIAGILGIALVLFGLIMTFVGTEPDMPGALPSLDATWDAIKQGFIVVTGGMLCSLFLWVWLNRYLPKMPYFNKLILAGGAGQVTVAEANEPDAFPSIGMAGKATTDLRPGGSAEFFDESLNDRRIVDVVSDSGFIRVGTNVVVREVSGSRVVVREMNSAKRQGDKGTW